MRLVEIIELIDSHLTAANETWDKKNVNQHQLDILEAQLIDTTRFVREAKTLYQLIETEEP